MESVSGREKDDEHPSGSVDGRVSSVVATKRLQNERDAREQKAYVFLNKILEMTLALLWLMKGRQSSESTQVRQCPFLVKST